MEKARHFLYCPFTGLGLYGGFRGNRWLRNRIEVFKRFTVQSLKAQTNQNFIIWVSWRRQERYNPMVIELELYLQDLFGIDRVVFTYNGLCFWDDKYEDKEARARLMDSLHGTLAHLVNYCTEDEVIMTIQPSDDCFHKEYVDSVQTIFKEKNVNLVAPKKGYLMNYTSLELKEYNPQTNPPFFSIRFKKEDFIDPFRHAEYTGPYKSHEYAPDFINPVYEMEGRPFLVGTHGENVSTHFDHPYGQAPVDRAKLAGFGLRDAEPLKLRYSIRKQILRRLPHSWRRKLRYYCGEMVAQRVYNFLRN